MGEEEQNCEDGLEDHLLGPFVGGEQVLEDEFVCVEAQLLGEGIHHLGVGFQGLPVVLVVVLLGHLDFVVVYRIRLIELESERVCI